MIVFLSKEKIMTNIMLDLETFGLDPNAAIVAIGAVEFFPESNTLGDEFYKNIELRSSVESGGIIDPDVVVWWMKQEKGAKDSLFVDGQHSHSVLLDFLSWIKSLEGEPIIWGNGSAFDNVVLRQSYKRSSLQEPWSYKNDRCYRTVRGMYPDIKPDERIGIEHNALDDAKNQALHLMKILRTVTKTEE